MEPKSRSKEAALLMWQVFNLASERVEALDNQDIAVLLGGSRKQILGLQICKPQGKAGCHPA